MGNRMKIIAVIGHEKKNHVFLYIYKSINFQHTLILQILHMSIEFMEDVLIWDAAIRLELVHDDVKNG